MDLASGEFPPERDLTQDGKHSRLQTPGSRSPRVRAEVAPELGIPVAPSPSTSSGQAESRGPRLRCAALGQNGSQIERQTGPLRKSEHLRIDGERLHELWSLEPGASATLSVPAPPDWGSRSPGRAGLYRRGPLKGDGQEKLSFLQIESRRPITPHPGRKKKTRPTWTWLDRVYSAMLALPNMNQLHSSWTTQQRAGRLGVSICLVFV
jgi:hypothetical protein